MNLIRNKLRKKAWLKRTYIFAKTMQASIYDRLFILSYSGKRSVIIEYAKKYRRDTFIETGTFLGDTIESLKHNFNKLISIELSEELAQKAQKRFIEDSNVAIIYGDSGKILPDILKETLEPCLFWLDGHYSSEFFIGSEYIRTAKGNKETPILEELDAILSHPVKNHVILIDDARCFTGKGDYPKISDIKKKLAESKAPYKLKVKNDIIRIIPTR